MSSLYLAVEFNAETIQKLTYKQHLLKSQFEGEYEDPTRFHITVCFLAKNEVNANTAILGMNLLRQIYTPQKFTVVANCFRQFDQGVAWVGMDNTMPLYELKYQIEDCMRRCNFPMVEDKFDGYIPHITMAYDFKGDTKSVVFGEPIQIEIDNISLWNAPKCNDVYIHNKLCDVKFK